MTPAESPRAQDRPRDLLRSLARTLTGVERVETVAYVVLSLGAAFAGSLAALLLVPLGIILSVVAALIASKRS